MKDQAFKQTFGSLILVIATWLWAGAVSAGAEYRPFVLAESMGSTVAEASAAVVEKLESGGWEVLGRYNPYDDDSATIIGATSMILKLTASGEKYGGFGGVIRVAVTENQGKIEVTYSNPMYLGYAYRIGDLSQVADELKDILGGGESFGAKGLSEKQLQDYNYMMFMPYFTDRKVIATFKNHREALQKVTAALQNPKSDMTPVWVVQLDSKQTVFGVKLERGKWKGQMKGIMEKIDTATPKSTAALPWELLVTGRELVYLPGKFRIAIMFPDLTMGQFMEIAEVPDNMDETAENFARLVK